MNIPANTFIGTSAPAVKPSCVAVPRQTERETCGRCGGDGRYPSSCYNGVCLGCNGRGYRLTKRGAAADAYLTALRSKPVEQLKVGDLVRERFGMAGQILAFAEITKLEVTTMENAGVWHIVNGERTISPGFNVELEHAKFGKMRTAWAPGSVHRVAQTAEQKLATLNQALDYQDTLTQQGKPRKISKAERADAADYARTEVSKYGDFGGL